MKKRGKLINWIFYAFMFGFIFIGILGVRKVEAADSTKSTTMTNEEVDQFIDDWIKTNIKDSMTDYEKAYKIYEYIGSYSYNYRISNYYNFIRYGQGDCFAFSYAYQRFCNEAGLTCYTRWANMDKGAGSNHRNNVIYINGIYYIVDCNAKAIGGERFDKQRTPFLYTIENGKATYVQYFGIGGKVEVPSVIEGCPVTEIRKSAFCCDNAISVVEIPSSVEKLPEPFATSTGKEEYTIKEFQIDKGNPNYKSVNGDIYSKDGKRLIFFAPNKADFIVEDGTEVISDYAGYNAGRGTELTTSTINVSTGKITTAQAMDSIKLPNSLRKIGDNVFCDVLGDLTIPEGVEEIGNDIVKSVTGGLILPSSLQKIGTISTKIVKFQGKDVEIGSKSGKVETVFALKDGKIEQFCKENNIQFVSEEDAKLQKDWFKLSGSYVSLSDKAPSWLQKNMYEVEWVDTYSKKVVAKKFATGSTIISHTVGIKGRREATCTETGYEGTEYCIDCSMVLNYGKMIPALGHHWEESGIQKPTCTEWGKKQYTCGICGATNTEDIPLAQHQITIKGKKEADCAIEGYTGDEVCSVCGQTIRQGTKIDKTNNHKWDTGKVTTEATCTSKGENTYICEVCGTTKIEEIPITEHKFTTANKKEATCTEDGYTGGMICEICNTIVGGNIIPATGHTPEKIGLKKSTCTSKGYTGDVVCKTCGTALEKGHETNLIQHIWDKGKVTTAATYWRTGVKTFTCAICNNHKTTVLPKIAMPKTGTKYIVGGNTYVITKAGSEVSFTKTNAKAKSITVPNTIKVSGITYKVTSIGANAFKNCKKLTSVYVGANVVKITNGAFNNDPALKTVIIKTMKLTKETVSKKAFNKVNKKMVIKVPKKVKKTYINIFKGYTVK